MKIGRLNKSLMLCEENRDGHPLARDMRVNQQLVCEVSPSRRMKGGAHTKDV